MQLQSNAPDEPQPLTSIRQSETSIPLQQMRPNATDTTGPTPLKPLSQQTSEPHLTALAVMTPSPAPVQEVQTMQPPTLPPVALAPILKKLAAQGAFTSPTLQPLQAPQLIAHAQPRQMEKPQPHQTENPTPLAMSTPTSAPKVLAMAPTAPPAPILLTSALPKPLPETPATTTAMQAPASQPQVAAMQSEQRIAATFARMENPRPVQLADAPLTRWVAQVQMGTVVPYPHEPEETYALTRLSPLLSQELRVVQLVRMGQPAGSAELRVMVANGGIPQHGGLLKLASLPPLPAEPVLQLASQFPPSTIEWAATHPTTAEAEAPLQAITDAQATLAAIPSPAVETSTVETTFEEVLLQFVLDGQPSPQLLSARREGENEAYLPLGGMMQALGFPITVNGNMGVAQGWFVSQDRTFKLNETDNTVEIAGKRIPLPAGALLREDNEIYVRKAELEKWFPVKMDVAMASLEVTAQSTEILPEAARLARQNIWQQRSKDVQVADTSPLQILPRSLADWPGIKLDYGTSFQSSPGTKLLAHTLGLQAQGNLLGMDGFLSLGIQRDNRGNRFGGGSFRLSRDSISASETFLGPLAATHVEVGDVTLPRISMVPTTSQGRGFSFHNKPVGFVNSLNQFEIIGDAPAGWDVEVYEGASLLAFTTVDADRRYRFDDVNLRPGLNDFRIVLYGPQGEKQERRQSYYLGEGIIAPGKWVYEAGLTESNAPLIAADTKRTEKAGTLVLNSFYGLNRNLSLNLGVASGPVNNQDRVGGATIGARAAYGRSFTQANLSTQSDQTFGFNLQERIRLGATSDIGAFYTRTQSATLDPLTAENILGLKFTSTANLGTPIRYGFNYTHNIFKDETSEDTLGMTQNWRLGKIAFNHALERTRKQRETRFENGELGFSTTVKGLPLRGAVRYQPEADDWLNSILVATQVNVAKNNDTILNLQTQYQPTGGLTTVQSSLQRDIGNLTLGLNSNWQSNNSYQVGLNLGMQFMPEPGAGPSWKSVPAKGEGFGYGSADMVVFIDDNTNGVLDAGEQRLSGVDVRNIRSGATATTNANGMARLTDLLPGAETKIEVVQESLPDLYLKAITPANRLLAHNGYGGKVNLPLIRMGEIAGILKMENIPATSTVTLWLADTKGTKLETIQPEQDGSFYFQSVPLGTYNVFVQVKDATPTPHQVTLTKARPMRADMEIELKQ